MKKLYALLGGLIFIITNCLAQPPNDNCNTSTNLPRQAGNTCTSTIAATTVAATPSSQTAIGGSANIDDDIWFDFTLGAGQTNGIIRLSNLVFSGPNNGIIMQLWLTDCATSQPYSALTGAGIGSSYDWNLTGLNPGASYKVRVYTDNITSRVTFNACFLAGPVNDDCANAQTLTPIAGTNSCVFVPGTANGSTFQATPSSQASGDGAGKDDDVWYQFTTEATPKNYTVNLNDIIFISGFGNGVIELWQLCGDATFISWFPFATSADLGTLLTNTNYKIRVYTYGTSTRFSSFNICVSFQTPSPANNHFSNASLVTLSNSTTCANILTGGTTAGATPDNIPTCSGAPSSATANDVWYKFIPTTAQATIKLTNKTIVEGASNLMWLQVYESSNTNLKLCAENNGADSVVFDGTSLSKTLTPGTTYYLRIYNHDPASACTFNICNYLPKGPLNDNCLFAYNLLISSNEDCNNRLAITNANATTSTTTAPPCVTTVYNDVWLKFVAPTPLPTTGLRFSIQNFQLVTGSNPNLRYAVYGGNCSGLTYLSCDNLPTLTSGQTYFIRVFSASGSGTGNFEVCLSPNPTTLTNISCASAVTLVASTDQSATYTQGTTLGLTTLNTITDCFAITGSPNKVLWYKFIATATSHFVQFTDMVQLSTNANSLGYRVTTGSCPSTSALSSPVCIAGVNNQNQSITGLTIGQTYFIEVLENTFNGGPVSYKLRVIGTNAPANDNSIGSSTIIQNPTCSTTNGSFRFSTLSASVPASLGATYFQDVWYKFKAATTSATINIAGRLAQPRIAIYNFDGSALLYAGVEGYSYSVAGLSVGVDYTIRVLNTSSTSGFGPTADFTICVSGVPSSTLAIGPTPISCLTNDNVVTSNNSNTWLHFTRGGNLIASVFDAANMGNMVAKYFINTAAIRSSGGVEYLDRNVEITPTSQPLTPVTIRLYFTKAEFDAFTESNDNDDNDAFWLNDLKISKFASLSCTSVIGGSGEEMFGIAGYGSLSASVYFLDVIVPSFSGFYIKNVASNVALPATCSNFNYKLFGNNIQLMWSTQTETNSSYFEIQKSTDGINFSTIANLVASNNSAIQKNYQFIDKFNANELIYYRIKQVDKDGKEQFVCKTLKVNGLSKVESFSTVYPNPANNQITVDILKMYSGKTEVQIVNAVGQIVSSKIFNLQNANTQLKMDVSKLAAGIFTMRIISTNEVVTKQFTKL